MCWLYFAVLHQDSIDLSAFLNVGWRLNQRFRGLQRWSWTPKEGRGHKVIYHGRPQRALDAADVRLTYGKKWGESIDL